MTTKEIKDLHTMLNECSVIFASSETPAAKLNALAKVLLTKKVYFYDVTENILVTSMNV